MEVAKIILGKPFLKNGEGLFVNLLNHQYDIHKWSKNLECILCSHETIKAVPAPEYLINQSQIDTSFNIIDIALSNIDIEALDPNQKYLLVCPKGFKSRKLARAYQEMGFTNIYSLNEGSRGLTYDSN
jgi:rhodanese-related sulfurtransferase